MLTFNYHTHTTFCDGSSTPQEMVERAMALGFTSLGFSGHVDIDPVMDVEAYLHEIRRLQALYGDRIEILCGGEFDSCYADPLRGGFDYKIGSNHHLDVGADRPVAVDYSEEMFVRLLYVFYAGDAFALARDYYAGVAKVYDRIHCNVIGHFDLVTKYNHHLHVIDEDDPRYVDPAMAALDALLSEDVAFEINTRMVRTGRVYPHERFLKRIREKHGEIIISSDAHNAAELNAGFDTAVELARRCGFDHTNRLTMQNGCLELVPVGI